MVCLSAAGAAERPNILVVLADDMGFGDLGCTGSTQIKTPNIDALAAGGILCTDGYVSGAVCAPSRAGLMTGRYQNRFGYEHNRTVPAHVKPEYVAVAKEERMIPAYLKEAGYATAIVGKWHLGGQEPEWHHPLGRGFDYYFGRYGGHGYFPKDNAKGNILRGRDPVEAIEVPYMTDWYTKEAIDFIERVPSGQPWFLYLAHDTPHTPLQAREDDIRRYRHIDDRKRRIYAAMQHRLDQSVGAIVDRLKEKGQFDNTLIVFLSDNGGPCTANASINAPLRGQKSMVLEGGVRVPYIFSWPAGLPAGQRYREPFISLDLLPTFLAAAGIDREAVENPKRPLDGVDLLPFFRGEREGEPPHESLYWRIILRGAAIRDGNWKLVRLYDRPPMLFDLSRDISEQEDLAASDPDRVRVMMKKLFEWEISFDTVPLYMSGMNWMRQHWKQYDREYQLEQP